MTFLDIGSPPTIETLSQGWEGNGSGVYNPNFMLLCLLVAHKKHPLTYMFYFSSYNKVVCIKVYPIARDSQRIKIVKSNFCTRTSLLMAIWGFPCLIQILQ